MIDLRVQPSGRSSWRSTKPSRQTSHLTPVTKRLHRHAPVGPHPGSEPAGLQSHGAHRWLRRNKPTTHSVHVGPSKSARHKQDPFSLLQSLSFEPSSLHRHDKHPAEALKNPDEHVLHFDPRKFDLHKQFPCALHVWLTDPRTSQRHPLHVELLDDR